MTRFIQYEEYSARCTLLSSDLDDALRNCCRVQDLDRALEALGSSMSSMDTREARLKQALGLKDLVIKVGAYTTADFGNS